MENQLQFFWVLCLTVESIPTYTYVDLENGSRKFSEIKTFIKILALKGFSNRYNYQLHRHKMLCIWFKSVNPLHAGILMKIVMLMLLRLFAVLLRHHITCGRNFWTFWQHIFTQLALIKSTFYLRTATKSKMIFIGKITMTMY